MILDNKKGSRRLLLAAIVSVFLVVTWLLLASTPTEERDPASMPLMPVTVVALTPENQHLTVGMTALTEARWVTGVVAAVQGRVKALPESLEPGSLVEKGDLLALLEATPYQAEVDSAASRLAATKLALSRARHEQSVALNVGRSTNTPLSRHELQVEAAQAEQQAAESALAHARQQLNDTRIAAPFDGIILQRKVTPGQWVQMGELLYEIADRHSLDVRVSISEKRWQRLGDIRPGKTATIKTHSGDVWPATVRFLSPSRAQKTRQRELVLKISSPFEAANSLLPDQQVEAVFSGPERIGIFDAPASVLTADGKVWTLDDNDQLQLENIELLFQGVERVLIRFHHESERSRRVVLYPLGSMLQGQQVTPRQEKLAGGLL